MLVVVVGVDGVDGICGGLFMVCVCHIVSLLTLVLLVVGIVSCDWIESKFVRLGVGRGVTYKGDSSAIPYGLSA